MNEVMSLIVALDTDADAPIIIVLFGEIQGYMTA